MLKIQVEYDKLAEHTPRTASVEAYQQHIRVRFETAAKLHQWMKIKVLRRWKFHAYQKEQRAIPALALALLGGLSPTNTIVT